MIERIGYPDIVDLVRELVESKQVSTSAGLASRLTDELKKRRLSYVPEDLLIINGVAPRVGWIDYEHARDVSAELMQNNQGSWEYVAAAPQFPEESIMRLTAPANNEYLAPLRDPFTSREWVYRTTIRSVLDQSPPAAANEI